jgi:hypothetical protein
LDSIFPLFLDFLLFAESITSGVSQKAQEGDLFDRLLAARFAVVFVTFAWGSQPS